MKRDCDRDKAGSAAPLGWISKFDEGFLGLAGGLVEQATCKFAGRYLDEQARFQNFGRDPYFVSRMTSKQAVDFASSAREQGLQGIRPGLCFESRVYQLLFDNKVPGIC